MEELLVGLLLNTTPQKCSNYITFLHLQLRPLYVPGDGIKHDPERENLAVLTIAAQTANLIHILVTFNAVTR